MHQRTRKPCTRSPSEAQPPRMERAGAAAGVLRARRQARGGGGRQRRPRPGRRNCCRPRARRSMSTPPSRRDEMLALAADPPARRGRASSRSAGWHRPISPAPRSRSAPSTTTTKRRAFAAAARAAGVPVNVIDKPAFCDFSFGAIVNRSPLVIGISTDGAAPVFAQAIRAKLEALIPRGFARWAEAARRWRDAVQGIRPVVRRPAAVLADVHRDTRCANPDREPAAADYERLLAETHDEGAEQPSTGSVTLVGAGPGDPELLTLRAVRALQSADVILFDDLVAPEILDFARREAKKMLVGKTGFGPSCKQDEINALMVGAGEGRPARGAAQGRRSDDLRPRRRGDRGLPQGRHRGRGGARHHARRRARPAGSASRSPIATLARRLQYVTGHGADGTLPADIDWASLADPVDHHRGLHAEARAGRACGDGAGPRAFRPTRRRSRWSRRRGRIRRSSPERSRTSPRGSKRQRRSVRC